MEKLKIKTVCVDELIDITSKVQQVVNASKTDSGICMVFVPHTTAAVTINENADPSVRIDIIKELDVMVPKDDGYEHREGNSAAHIKASCFGFSESIIIENRVLQLGTWQGIYFCEFDGPRTREVWIKCLNFQK